MTRKTAALLLALLLLTGVMHTGLSEIGALQISRLNVGTLETSTEMPFLGYDPDGKEYPFTGTDDETREHTVMLYLCGADLEGGGFGKVGGAATKDLKEVLGSGYDRNRISVIVMAGGAQKWFNNAVDKEDTAIYEVLEDSLVKRATRGLKDMGDTGTLSDFINFCYDHYPAKHFSLILWDHGGGPLSGLIDDFLSGGRFQSVLKVREALDQTPAARNKLYLLGFDACLEGSVEIAKVFAPYAEHMVASEESEPGYGWNYSFLKDMEADESPAQTANRIIETCFQQYPKNVAYKITLSSVDLNRIDELMEKTSAFFKEVRSQLDDANFAEYAALRQKLEPVDMDNPKRDLVDLKETVETFGKYAPDQAQELLNVIREAITGEKHTTDGVSCGLSIYFPYFAYSNYSKRLNQNYKALGFNEDYTQFIDEFNLIQQEAPKVNWQVGTSKDAVRDTRTLLSVQLTPEQAANVAEYSLAILWLNNGDTNDPTYVVVNPQEDEVEMDGTQLNGYYVHHALYIVGGNEEEAYPYPLVWSRDTAGHYLVPATLIGDGIETEIQLVCDADKDTGEMTVVALLVKDEPEDYYTSRVELDLDGYGTIVFKVPVYKPVRDGSGAYTGVFEWTVDHEVSYALDMRGQWTLAITQDSIRQEELWAGFVLTDYSRQTHTSELIPIVPSLPTLPVFVLTYDDDYLDMKTNLANVVSSNGEDLYVMLTVKNPTEISTEELGTFANEHEIFVHFGDVLINGEPVDTELWIEGFGPNDGIPVGDQNTDTLILPGIEAGSVQSISLVITVVDAATDEELAVIPAAGYLYVPNN